jgi:hypothetical protein
MIIFSSLFLFSFFQAEISNEVIYFSPKEALMFFGELYTKNGVSLTQETRKSITKVGVADTPNPLAISLCCNNKSLPF